MNTTFKIVPALNNENACNLLLEISESNVAVFCYSTYPFTAQGFYYFSVTENDKGINFANNLKATLQAETLHTAHFNQIDIFYNFADTTLVPTTFFKEAEKDNVASLMFGNKTDSISLHETITELDIENIYAVPNSLLQVMDEIYPTAKKHHSLSKIIQPTVGTTLLTTIYEKDIRLVLMNKNNLLLAAYFDYNTPEDVCYHMLNACQQNSISAEIVHVILNGMIDTNSNLYKEIYKFFLNINTDILPKKVLLAEGFDGLSEHYFSPLVKLAKCVS